MHIGLLDRRWEGHHTVFTVRRGQYLVDAGHDVTFITTRDHQRLDALPADDSFSVELVPTPPDPGVLRDRMVPGKTTVQTAVTYRRALAAAVDADVDLLHVLHLNPDEFPLWIASRWSLPFPLLATVHRDHYEWSPGLDAVNRVGFDRCLRDGTLSKVFVNVETQEERIRSIFPDANHGNVETIPLATPHPPEGLSKADARERLDLPRDLPILFFFAGHRYEQGPDILLDAVREFDRPVAVVFAGSPGYVTSDDLEAFERADGGEAGIVNRIGWIPEEDVYPYFVAADAAVMPFRRPRGVSETLSRACLTNTHSIASDDSDVGYLVDRYDLGQTFDRGSVSALRATIRTFLDDRESYPLPGIEEYGRGQSIERTGEQLESAYRDVLERYGT